MKTQKQLKFIAIETFANAIRQTNVSLSDIGWTGTEEELAQVNKMADEFKVHMVNRFAGTLSKKSEKFSAKAIAKADKAAAKKAKLAEKEAKIQQKAEAKLARDTARAEKLAVKLEAAKAKVAAPAEVVTA